MKTPKTLESIHRWKERRGSWDSVSYLIGQIVDLQRHWQNHEATLAAVADFFPIRLVTLIEVFFRLTVSEIVNSAPAMLKRATGLTNGMKFDLLFAADLYGHKLSVGDIVAHSLPVNGIEQIISVLETLLPGYRGGLTTAVDRVLVELHGQPESPIIANIDETIARLVRLFLVRHIVVHERPTKPCYELEEVEGFICAAKQFAQATDEFVTFQLHGKVPLTQRDMTEAAGESLQRATVQMMHLLDQISERGAFPGGDLLEENQRLWSAYAENKASLEGMRYEGGSMRPMIQASALEEMAGERAKMLQRWLDEEEL